MKILIVHYRYFISGGPERYMFNVIDALKKQGHTIIPFSIKNENNVKSEYEDYFVENIGKSNEVYIDKYKKNIPTIIDIFSREMYSFKVRRKLEKLIKKTNPDICYLLAYKRALSPSVIDACHKYNIPIINRISDYNTVCGSGSLYRSGQFCKECFINDNRCYKNKCIKNKKTYSLLRYLSIKFHKSIKIEKKIDKYICTNKFMYEMMLEYGYDKNKLKVIPTFFKEREKYIKANKDNLINGKVNLLFIGNVDESKGIYDLLNALHELKKMNYENFHLDIVGGLRKQENEKMIKLISKYNLEDNITIVSFVKGDEIFDYYLKNNITVLPARWVENLPNTLIESLYFNRPVIVPDFGSFVYTTNSDVAFKYKALSVSSLMDTIKKILDNPILIEEKSKNCESFFKNNYSEKIHVEELIKTFACVIKEKNNE